MNTDTVFNYSDDIMRHLYALHQLQGKDCIGNYEGFCNSLVDYVDDIGIVIFQLLPKIDLPEDITFYDALDDKELEQLSGLANLLGIRQQDCPFQIIPDAMPDICLDEEEEGWLQITTFQNNYPAIFALGDEAADLVWRNFTVGQMQEFSEDEQRVFLRMVDSLDLDFSDEDNIKSHKRLVFGLHIPQDLQDYHDECIYEFGVRMLTDTVYIDFLDLLAQRIECEEKNILLLENDDRKRLLVKFFMQQLADIWQIPEPNEEPFSQEPEIDKEGEEFSTFMHAFYRAASNDNKPSGLMFGINEHNGYLSPKYTTTSIYKSLAHEFGHLISDFLVVHAHHKPWVEFEQTRKLIQESMLVNFDSAAHIMTWNNQYRRPGAYYSAVKTDFSGLPKPKGHHIYKGQLEERHADYVGNGIRHMIEFCLNTRGFVFDISCAKIEFQSMAKSILKHLGDEGSQDEAIALIETLFDGVQTDEDLHESFDLFNDYVQHWIDENVNMDEENRRLTELRKNGDNFTTRNLFAIKHFEDFKKFGKTFLELRARIADIDFIPEQAAKNSLSL